MLKLIHVEGSTFAVRTEKFTAVGTLDEARDYLIEDRGIDPEEIACALMFFQEQSHNVADFGLAGMLTYTESLKINIAVTSLPRAA